MRKMFEVEFIRKMHDRGWSIRKISRHLGMSRPTVRKALRSAEIPKYNLAGSRPAPVMDGFSNIVLAWLEGDKHAPTKQRHTAKRIYNRLVDEYGFKGGESTVRRFVARNKPSKSDVFIPLTCDYGEVAEVDWGQAHVRIAGVPEVAHLFCLKLKRSNAPFAMAFPTEKLEAFLAGHVAGFDWIGGVPASLVYDNPKTAVTKILAGPEREIHRTFSSLRAHYLFDSIFCAPGAGNEKGSVENLVGYVRRNALVPVGDFASYAHLNEHLRCWCEIKRQANLDEFTKEAAALRELPATPFKAAVTTWAVVSKLSLITFDRSRYSVPSRFRGRRLRVEAYWDRLEFFADGALVCAHARSHSRGATIMDIAHYLGALERKPRAVCHAGAVRELGAVFESARKRLMAARADGYRDFAEIVLLLGEFDRGEVEAALASALDLPTLSGAVVRRLILNGRGQVLPLAPVPPALADFKVNLPDLSIYDALIAR